MSTSFDERNERSYSKKTTTPWENEEKTETETNYGDEKDCCRRRNKLSSSTSATKVSDRDILITTLQNELKSMENLYKKTFDEQQDIRKKYADSVQKLSKGECAQKMPKVELTEIKELDTASQEENLHHLRTKIINRLEVSKMKPKKCCRYLYEALGVEIPVKFAKKERKKVAKPAKKSSDTTVADENFVDLRRDTRKEGKEKEECKQICSDLNKTEGYKNAEDLRKQLRAKIEEELKNKDQKWPQCKNMCGEFRTKSPAEIEARAAEYKRIMNELTAEHTQKHGLQKELDSQGEEMQEQEKELCDLQNKLKKLCQSMECLERSRTWANKFQSHSTTRSKPISPDKLPEKIEIYSHETDSDVKHSKKEHKKKSSRCCTRSPSQESRKKSKSQKGSDNSSILLKHSATKLEDFNDCILPKPMIESVQTKKYAEQTKSVTLYHEVSYKVIDVQEPSTKDKKAKSRSSSKQNPRVRKERKERKAKMLGDTEGATKIIITSYDKELANEKFPCYEKCVGEKNVAQTKSMLEETDGKSSAKQTKSATLEEEDFKNSTMQSDKKEKKKSCCCGRKKSKSQENLSDNKSTDKSEERTCCDIENCPFKTFQNEEFRRGQTERFKHDTKRRESFSSYCRCSSPKEKRSKSENATRLRPDHHIEETEERACCDLDDCPLNKERHWNATKSKEILCCDLDACSKHDAFTSTHQSCHEKCPKNVIPESPQQNKAKTKSKSNAEESKKKDAYEKALKANKDLETQIKSQKMVVAQKDETIENLENQLKETIIKNKTLLCKFGCQLDELKTGYENAKKEVARLKEHKEALNQKLLACLNDNAESTNNVEKLKAGHQLALREKAEMEQLVRQKEIEINELKNKLQQELNEGNQKKAQNQDPDQSEVKTMTNEVEILRTVTSEQGTIEPKEMAVKLACADPKINYGELEKCESKYNELKSEYDQLKEKLEISENECVLLKGKNDDLENAFDKINQENKELKLCKLESDQVKDECRKECDKLKDESNSKMQEVLAELQDVRREKNELEERNGEQISKLENQIVDLDVDVLAMREANTQLSEELAKAKNDLESLRNLQDQLTKAKNNSENELSEKQEELRQLQDAFERKSQEFEAAINEKVNTDNHYEAQIGDLKCCLEEQKCCYEDVLNELESAKNASANLSQDLENLQGRNTSLNNDVAIWKRMYESDLENVKNQLAETRAELQRTNEKLAESEEQLKCTVCEYECKLYELINKYDSAQEELQEYQENERKLKDNLAMSSNELEKVKFEAEERTNEYQQEKIENQKLRRELNQSTDDFHQKEKTLEEISLVLEKTRRDKTNMEDDLKKTIRVYESKVNELGKAQDLTKTELLNLKDEANRSSQENQKLKTRLNEKEGDLDETQRTITLLTKEVEDLRALKADLHKNNEILVSSCNSKIEKLTADYQEAQEVIQRLNKTLDEMNAEMNDGAKKLLANSIDSTEKESVKNEDKTEGEKEAGTKVEIRAKCTPECQRRCAERKKIISETKLPKSKREDCKKICAALKKPGESRDQIERPQTDSEKQGQEKVVGKIDEPINKECRDLCAELNSIKKMLSDIEIVSTSNSKPNTSDSGLESPLKGRNKKSLDYVGKQKSIVRETDSWKEKYEKTALERDSLKQEISEMYNKLKEVMSELENKLNV